MHILFYKRYEVWEMLVFQINKYSACGSLSHFIDFISNCHHRWKPIVNFPPIFTFFFFCLFPEKIFFCVHQWTLVERVRKALPAQAAAAPPRRSQCLVPREPASNFRSAESGGTWNRACTLSGSEPALQFTLLPCLSTLLRRWISIT